MSLGRGDRERPGKAGKGSKLGQERERERPHRCIGQWKNRDRKATGSGGGGRA